MFSSCLVLTRYPAAINTSRIILSGVCVFILTYILEGTICSTNFLLANYLQVDHDCVCFVSLFKNEVEKSASSFKPVFPFVRNFHLF